MKQLTSIIALCLTALPLTAAGADNDHADGRAIVASVNSRDDGLQVSRDAILELTDRRGITRVERTSGYRKYFGDEKRTVIFYTEPTNVRGTGFLTWDHADRELEDDQWLYLPALGKVRRISASDRGDYFLGTDLTYEEIKKENKIEIDDYRYLTIGESSIDGTAVINVEAIPVTDTISKELGYSRIVYAIDPEINMSRQIEFWDINGNHLKTIDNQAIEKIDGIWTTVRVQVTNHKTGHSTLLRFENIDYQTEIPDRVFTRQALELGLR